LSGKEEAALEEGIAEMIHDGIIVRTDDHRPTYRLTRKGRELLCR
jgi:predicted transcriptional regulator